MILSEHSDIIVCTKNTLPIKFHRPTHMTDDVITCNINVLVLSTTHNRWIIASASIILSIMYFTGTVAKVLILHYTQQEVAMVVSMYGFVHSKVFNRQLYYINRIARS